MDAVRSKRLLDLFAIAVFTVLAVFIGYGPVRDLDLGWHLAGGLWMLENGGVPGTDMLGAESRPWIAYSWLPELIYAVVFRWQGFAALQHLQFLSILALFAVLYSALTNVSAAESAEGEIRIHARALLAVVLTVPLVFPVLHLRPQLWSLILLALLMGALESGRRTLRFYLPLCVLWANIHVFWVFVPLLVFISGAKQPVTAAKKAAVLVFAGAVSPYGYENIAAVLRYALSHQEAYRQIQEFFPLRADSGFVFWYFLASLAVVLWAYRRSASLAPIAAAIFAGAAVLQRKYLPSYGVCVSFCLNRALPLPRIAHKSSGMAKVVLAIALAGSLGATLYSAEISAPLEERHRHLFAAAEALVASESRGDEIVLNEFDDGGFLSLALRLAEPHASRFRTAIDGRTLVMGEERLKEFHALRERPLESCPLLKRWSVGAAVLPKTSPVHAAFLQSQLRSDPQTLCFRQWALIYENTDYAVLQRMGGAAK